MKSLRVARVASGLKQADLARRSGIPQQVISEIERGRREPTVAELDALARTLAAQASALVTAASVGEDE